LSTPLVTVIVPNYNHAKYLPARMESILNQGFQDFEVIILDDCSDDNSKEVIEQYRSHEKVSCIEFNDRNSGSPFHQWNRGVKLSKGSLIWMAESDDYCKLDFLEETVTQMKSYPSAGIVYTQSLEVDEISGTEYICFHDSPRFKLAFLQSYFAEGRREISTKLVYENTIPNASGVLFRKSVYEQVNGADESMKLCGDWFIWAKMLLVSDLYFIKEPLNYFRLTANSVRSKNSKLNTFHERLVILHYLAQNHIKGVGKSEIRLLKSLFSHYTFNNLGQPIKKVMMEKENIQFPRLKILWTLILSLFDRFHHKFQNSGDPDLV
jgi:glycosyltransferase involved in cell wall biosynthesis